MGMAGAQRRRRGRRPFSLKDIPFFDESGRGAVFFQQRKVAPIRKERDLPRLGMLDSCHAANLEFRGTFQSASQFLRNFRKFHGEGSSVLCGAVCESRTGQRRKYSRPASYSLKRRG